MDCTRRTLQAKAKFASRKNIRLQLSQSDWTITVQNFSRIDTVYNKFLRSMIRNGWACAKNASDEDENFQFKWSTNKLHTVCNTIPISDFIKSIQWKCLGHLIRYLDHQARKQLLFTLDERSFYQKVSLIHQVSQH